MATRRPFFSLVVPCYNDGRYAPGVYIDRLLESVVAQGLKKSELEVIIVDDHSMIPYQGTLDRYSKKLNIKFIETDYNCCPGNTRDKGASIAKGEWLCFADHDDKFYPNAFNNVKKEIALKHEQHIVISNFNKVDCNDETKVVEEFRTPNLKTWLHGKFYNMDNLWRKYDIHFIKDLKTHEDIAMGDLISCALHAEGKVECAYVEEPTYMWTDDPRSTSNTNYVGKDGHPFVERYFADLIKSKTEPFFVMYKKHFLTQDEATIMLTASLINGWNLLAQFFRANPEKYFKENEGYCGEIWHRMKDLLGVNVAKIKVIYATKFDDIKAKMVKFINADPPVLSFEKWLDYIDTIDYKTLIDKAEARKIREAMITKIPEPVSETGEHRPFFSIIIPCYNDGQYEKGNYLDRLLDSICKQNVPRQDLEVIISDDHSPVSYDSIVAPYEDKLIIKRITTDYNFAPGNTRAKGLTIATGQWLAFADHDDIYYDGALAQVKAGLIERGEKYYALGDFNGVAPDGTIQRKFEKTMNWCHAKFYNYDNFWKPQGIHFIKDLKSHEDIAICTQVACAIQALNLENYTYFHFPVYAWTDNPQSVSHAKYTVDTETGPRDFLEVFFADYLQSTGGVYLEQFKEHKIKMLFAVKSVLEVICYCYFYTQGFQFKRPNDFYKANLAHAGNFVRECKKTFNLTDESIYSSVSSNGAAMYYQIRALADPGVGRYMPTQTFKQWLELVNNSYLEN